jgi:sterol desaturase/sphingolipid hydroxylase (fatty acid hydroxylase superfamily)
MTEFKSAGGLLLPGSFLAVTLVFIAAEYLYRELAADGKSYDARETFASIGVAIGDVVSRAAMGGLAAVPFFFLYRHRVFDIDMTSPAAWLALFLGVEFAYYWFHRASHRVRWLWATHATHHSATAFNLSAAIRLGWTGQLSGAFVFFLPLALLGFPPLAIAGMMFAGLVYQFFLHAAVPVRLGPLEWVLNTPSHHRVHHASNEECLDKNYGSVLIIFDRLFGTFANAPVSEPLKFGLKGKEPSYNPIQIALGEWFSLCRDTKASRSLREKVRTLFGPPK